MGLFRNIFRGTKTIIRTSCYLGGIYSFLAYFYVQEIKYQLNDSEEANAINERYFRQSIKSNRREPSQPSDADQFVVVCGSAISKLYTFYARSWNFREFDLTCQQFHKGVIRGILKNYESYGIFSHRKQMQNSLKRNQVSPEILKKILEVKQVNAQLFATSFNLYLEIIENQISMSTGAIIGLTPQQKSKIDLIYDYVERGLLNSSGNQQQQYWKYKLTQSQIKKHNYNDTIFKIIYI